MIDPMKRMKQFWNREYRDNPHFALSDEPAEDLGKFARWLSRNSPEDAVTSHSFVLDCGCGNGRNIISLVSEYRCKGFGFDISEEAITQAKKAAQKLPITFEVRSLAEPFPLDDGSADLVLDMMSSHVLREDERRAFFTEVGRVLRPGGWLFFKTHLRDGDIHSRRLLKDHAADEQGSYIHPRLGVYEHVWSEDEIIDFFRPAFHIVKILRSHKHVIRGRVGKRRTVSVYMQKR